ncbi:hypothetical protein BDN72DRAFT_845110 [Pluteus cervinus]|uniref:Uncharacterized protein n=1 Tax=Pluteus cervinus TaxID=181527 RepID=A0ACD3AJN4_9AGAR|nr:hypothetical protein BDN72DRAFT_845110 [Pluteus cervinus]
MDLLSSSAEERKKIIEGARKGSLRELKTLATSWHLLPNPLSEGNQSIFFHHLNSLEVPIKADIDFDGAQALMPRGAMEALLSLSALARLPECICVLATDPYGHEITQAWPGVFKWGAFLYTFLVHISSPNHVTNPKFVSIRRGIRRAISGSWSAVATSRSAKELMLKTRGVMEIAVGLWIFEDDPTTSVADVSAPSLLLTHLARANDKETMDHILSAAGGDLEKIAKLSLRRLKDAFNAPLFEFNSLDAALAFGLVAWFCRAPTPGIVEALLQNGAVSICVKLLIRIAFVFNERHPGDSIRPGFIKMMTRDFACLKSILDTIPGPPWVLQAIDAGLLTAFVECSPVYYDLEHSDFVVVSSTITHTIPRYLAYYGIVQAMDSALSKLEKTERFLSLRKTRAWKAFNALALLTARRLAVSVHWFKFLKKNASTCDNPKCEKVDSRKNFRKCGKCGSVLYCSKECQAIHWKEFGHKRKCKQPAKIKLDFHERYQADGGIPQRDFDYIQHLNVCETRYNLPYLKRLAATQHPGVPLDDLVVVIDYNDVPMTYHLILLKEYAEGRPEVYDFPKNPYRPDLEAESCTYALGMMPFGKAARHMLTLFPSEIWDTDRNPFKNGEELRVDPTGNKLVDWLDKEAEAKRLQYCGV